MTVFSFTLEATDGAARAGHIDTARGRVRTPAFMPVGTAGTVKAMYIFQGIVADVVWLPEAWRAFRARVRMMVEEYAFPAYQNNPYGEIVDRSIYPEATAEPFTLRWPEPAGGPGHNR